MTAVILAAGVASRLRPITETIPKTLLVVGGRSLLERNLTSLRNNGITRLVIVTGYLHEQIEAAVSSMNLGIETLFVHNPVYEQTNNNYSLWLAGPTVQGDGIVLLDGDILFHPEILTRLLSSPRRDALVIRRTNHLGHEEIKCSLDDDGAVLSIGKHVDPKTAAGESLGIEKFSPAAAAKLFEVLSRRHVHNEFYEASFQELIEIGTKVFTVDTGGLPCMEIDTPDDLAAAEELAGKLP